MNSVCVDGMVALLRELQPPPEPSPNSRWAWAQLGSTPSHVLEAAPCTKPFSALVSHDSDVRLVAASTWKWAL